MFTFEGPHDVFAPLTLASTVGGLDLMANVAIAFPRNPIQLAHQAIDHHRATAEVADGRRSTGRRPPPAEVAAHIRDRVDGIADEVCVYQPGPIAVDSLAQIVDALRT